MSYTLSLIRKAALTFIPLGDCIPGVRNNSSINTKEEQNRLKVAHAMQKAIGNGKLDATYEGAVDKMAEKAQRKLAEAHYAQGSYGCDQLAKVSTFIDLVSPIPGSGVIASHVANIARTPTFYQYTKDNPSTKDQVMKTAQIAFPIIAAATAPLWMPLLDPLMTASAIATGVGAVLGSALALDTINYIRG